MSLSAAVIAELVAAGLSGNALVSACERIEAAEKPARSSAAERQARYRERKKASRVTSRDERNVTDHAPYTEDAPTHAEPEPNKTTSPPPTSFAVAHDVAPRPVAKPKSTNAECVKALASVLDAEHAAAVVEHRNRIRKPMTGHAAALLAKSLSQAPNPNAAADEMIERGWQFWKPDWGRGQGPPGRVRENSLLAGIEEIEERRFGTSNVQHFPRIAG